MRLLLINSPIRLDAKPNCIPYGLAQIASVVRDAGHDVEVYDINGLRHSRADIKKMLLGYYEWDIVGVSGLITTYGFQKWLIPLLKGINPEANIICGGGLATSNPELIHKPMRVIAVRGEGEKAMLELCGEFARAAKMSGDLDNLPFPAWDLLPMETYLRNPIWGDTAGNSSGFKQCVEINRSMNVITSRGCPFSCNYCFHLFPKFRQRSVSSVIAEVDALVDRYDVDFIGFVDDNMMANRDWMMEFCRKIDGRVNWGCHGRVNSAEPEILKYMADSGCIWIGYGIESGSQKILDAMNKRATVYQAENAIRLTRAAGIHPNTTFIFGYPGETLGTIQETIDFKRQLGIECGSFYATPYPGTRLFEQVKHKIFDDSATGFSDMEAFVLSLGNATDFTVNLTEFDNEELFRLKGCQDRNEDVI